MSFLQILKATGKEWSSDRCPRLGAAIAYYTLFSIAPLLLIAVAVAGAVFGADEARGELMQRLTEQVGPQGATTLEGMLDSARRPGAGFLATVVGVGLLLVGASGVFAQVQDALDTVWGIRPAKDRKLLDVIGHRLASFAMVLGIGALLLVSLVASTVISGLASRLDGLPGGALLWQVVSFSISVSLTTVLFALIFKFLPDAKIPWRGVWAGAFFTAVLFAVGRQLIGLYLSRGSVGSVYGAAGSLVALLVFIYYSAQIFLFGAEFTQLWATGKGMPLQPSKGFELVPEDRPELALRKAA